MLPLRPMNQVHQVKIPIKVIDDAHKQEKDYEIEKDVIMKFLHYFEQPSLDGNRIEDIDVSIHCDIKVFEWLINYIQQRGTLTKAEKHRFLTQNFKIQKQLKDETITSCVDDYLKVCRIKKEKDTRSKRDKQEQETSRTQLTSNLNHSEVMQNGRINWKQINDEINN